VLTVSRANDTGWMANPQTKLECDHQISEWRMIESAHIAAIVGRDTEFTVIVRIGLFAGIGEIEGPICC
jgi:hypothetical protein